MQKNVRTKDGDDAGYVASVGESEVSTLDQRTLVKEITNLYTTGKISEDQYGMLKDMISDKH